MKNYIYNMWSSFRLKNKLQGIKLSILKDPIFLISFSITILIIHYSGLMLSENFQIISLKFFIGFFIVILFKLLKYYGMLGKISGYIINFLIIYIIGYYSGLFNIETIYASNGSEDLEKNIGNEMQEQKEKVIVNVNSDNENYNFALNKVKTDEGIKLVKDVLPNLGGAAAASSVANKMIMSSKGMPPLYRGLLGIGTAAGTYGAIKSIDTVLNIKKQLNNPSEVTINIGKEINNSEITGEIIKKSGIGNIMSNTIEYNDLYSPLETLLGYDIIFVCFIIFHIIIIILIFINKYYKTRSNKFIYKHIPEKYKSIYDKYINRMSNINDSFLNTLIVINVISIMIFLMLIIYINLDIIMNIDAYIESHINNKKK
jgi:hypothetical protein